MGRLWGTVAPAGRGFAGRGLPHGDAVGAVLPGLRLVLTSLRLLIAWAYAKSGSLLMAQSMHASPTGFLVVLGAAK